MSLRTEFGVTPSALLDSTHDVDIECDGASFVLIHITGTTGAVAYKPNLTVNRTDFTPQRAINFKNGDETAANVAITAVNGNLFQIPCTGASKVRIAYSSGAGSCRVSARPSFAGDPQADIQATIVAGGAGTPLVAAPVEVIDRNDATVAQNTYSKSVALPLGVASGWIDKVALVNTEAGTGKIRAPQGIFCLFDANPGLTSGLTSVPNAVNVIGTAIFSELDWGVDAVAARFTADLITGSVFVADTVYGAWFHESWEGFNENAADDEEMTAAIMGRAA